MQSHCNIMNDCKRTDYLRMLISIFTSSSRYSNRRNCNEFSRRIPKILKLLLTLINVLNSRGICAFRIRRCICIAFTKRTQYLEPSLLFMDGRVKLLPCVSGQHCFCSETVILWPKDMSYQNHEHCLSPSGICKSIWRQHYCSYAHWYT